MMKKTIVLSFAVFLLTVCINAKVGAALRDKKDIVHFKSEEGTLLVENRTAQDVVMLVGKPERNMVIGGVKSGEKRTFNLSKLPEIPSYCDALLVKAVPYRVYKEKTTVTEDDVVYTRLLFHNHAKTEISIPKELDVEQKYCLYFTNESRNLLLEVKDKNGQVLTTLMPGESNKRIFLLPNLSYVAYRFYPTFVYLNPTTKEISYIEDSKMGMKVGVPDEIRHAQRIDFNEPSHSTMFKGIAFINLKNNTSLILEFKTTEGLLRTCRGSRSFTFPRETDVYELPVSSDKGQLDSEPVLNFYTFSLPLSPYKFMEGYEYNVVVSKVDGKYQYDIQNAGQKYLGRDSKIKLFMED